MRAEQFQESAADELKRKLPSLKKPDYATIDRLMQRISARHSMTGKNLHDMFVSKYGETPDHWIKKYNAELEEGKPGLWANIHAKRERIKHGSGERMRKPGSKGAPSSQDFKDSQKTSKTEAANPAQQAAIAIAKKAEVDEDWQKVNKSDKTDGMSRKAVKAYRRENPGSKLKTAVTTKPSKLKKGSKSAKRRKSFCARMSGMKKAHASAKTKRDPDSPINKALRRWNCESIEELQNLVMIAEQRINEERSKVIAQTAKDLSNPPKVMQHRAKRDQEREETYKNAQRKKTDEDKIKGSDGKACWKGKRYAGTENGKDICIPVKKK